MAVKYPSLGNSSWVKVRHHYSTLYRNKVYKITAMYQLRNDKFTYVWVMRERERWGGKEGEKKGGRRER